MSAPDGFAEEAVEAQALPVAQQLQQPRKLTALERNNLEWESHKDEIQSRYMDQSNNLEETMHWFAEQRSFTWSKRYWKIKLKEWKFEKNVPAREMAFMASKARKRELELGKETMFYRNGIQLDQNKINSFKKQRLNVDTVEQQYFPRTPQHISYKTPKSILEIDCPSASSSNASESPKTLEWTSLETVKENPDLGDDLYAASPFQPNSDPVTSMVGFSIDNELVDLRQPAVLSETTSIDSKPSSSSGGTGQNLPRPLPAEGNLWSVQDENGSTLADDDWDDEVATTVTKISNGNISLAKLHLAIGQRLAAASVYASAPGNHIMDSGVQTNLHFKLVISELSRMFESCTQNEIPVSVCICFDLYGSLIQYGSPRNDSFQMISGVLKTMLKKYPGMPLEIDLEVLFTALDDPHLNPTLFPALQAVFFRRQVKSRTLGSCEILDLRFGLLVFACELRRYLHIRTSRGNFSTSKLNEATAYLRRTGMSVGGTPFILRSVLSRIYDQVKCLTVEPVEPLGYSHIDPLDYSSAEPLFMELASACSAATWFNESETLLAVLRHDQNSTLFELHISDATERMIATSFDHCPNLERNKRYAELLSELYDACTSYSTYLGSAKFYQLTVQALLDRVPLPLDQHIHSEKALAIVQLVNVFEIGDLRPSLIINATPRPLYSENVVVEKNKSQAREKDDEMDDCKSSNRFGVTYTESGMTDISFNYSDLFR